MYQQYFFRDSAPRPLTSAWADEEDEEVWGHGGIRSCTSIVSVWDVLHDLGPSSEHKANESYKGV
eukprot:1160459-Pelagomonas_calceolata.AAC.1